MAVALGAKDVVNFRGGTDAWKKAGLPLDIS
jgi:rhodanese-related sulfurtransferase